MTRLRTTILAGRSALSSMYKQIASSTENLAGTHDEPAARSHMDRWRYRLSQRSRRSEKGWQFFPGQREWRPALASLRFRLQNVHFFSSNAAFTYEGTKFNAGSFIIPKEGNPSDLEPKLMDAAKDLELRIYSANTKPTVAQHPIPVARIALVHTWTDTQNEGWFRLAFDRSGVDYQYISTSVVRDTPDLRSKYDVILIPPVEGGAAAILNGIPKRTLADGSDFGGPIPWRKLR